MSEWTLQRCISVAYRLGMFVCPFMQSDNTDVFAEVYRTYPGILLGEQPTGHALARLPLQLVMDSDRMLFDPAVGTGSPLYGPTYDRFTNRVYLAWTNSPHR